MITTKRPYLFSIAGESCTGKSTASKVFEQQGGYVISASATIAWLSRENNLPVHDTSLLSLNRYALASLYGPYFLARRIISESKKHATRPIICVEGIRSIKSLMFLKKYAGLFAGSQITSVFLRCSPEKLGTNYDCRLMQSDANESRLDDIRRFRPKKYRMGLKEIEAVSDRVIDNNGTRDDLVSCILELIARRRDI